MLSPLSSPAPRRALGTGFSAALHLAVVAVVLFGLPDLKRPAQSETVIPVEFVQLPEPLPPPPDPVKPEGAKPDPTPPPEPAKREAEKKPEPAKKPELAEKPADPPPAPAVEPRPTLEDVRPDVAEEPGVKVLQEAKRTDDPAEDAKKSDKKSTVIGRWLLEPLLVKHTGHPCGDAFESGTLELIGERGPGQFHGTLKTHVRWTRCAPQVASYYIELRIKGSDVVMVGSSFADRGTVSGDVMSLQDAYGTSVWRRQPVTQAAPAAPADRPRSRR